MFVLLPIATLALAHRQALAQLVELVELVELAEQL